MSDFNKIWWDFGLKCADLKYQVSSKSDHFSALFWLWIANERYSYPENLIFFFTHRSMKMGQVWKKSVTTIMELILLCTLKFRVWPHAHMGKLRPKIWCTVYYLPKRSHGVKFKQNPRNCPSGRSYDLENLSVKCNYFVVFIGLQNTRLPKVLIIVNQQLILQVLHTSLLIHEGWSTILGNKLGI